MLVIAQLNAVEETSPTEPGLDTPHVTNATISTAVMPKTILSRPKRCRDSSTLMPGTRPGWMSCGYSGVL